jgi:hypothetical protein
MFEGSVQNCLEIPFLGFYIFFVHSKGIH